MIGTNGLQILKEGIPLEDIPLNWKDHMKVIRGDRQRVLPKEIDDTNSVDIFEELTGQRSKIPLDAEHKRLIEYLEQSKAYWWWDQDHHMLVTHTVHLKEAHVSFGMRGVFDTISTGKERGIDKNCFLYPLAKGGWVVRRYGPGVQEAGGWDQDQNGWTRCYYNVTPNLDVACKSQGGLEDPSGGFQFRDAESAERALNLLGIKMDVGVAQKGRQTLVKLSKDGRVVVEVDHDDRDSASEMQQWLPKKGKWTRIYNNILHGAPEPEINNYDDVVRHLATEAGEDCGWLIKSGGPWRMEPLTHIQIALKSTGLGSADMTEILGSAIFKCWTLVNKPFQPEYPGDREWNRHGARLRFKPTVTGDTLKYPTWQAVLDHCGAGLNEALKDNPWAMVNGVTKGGDYLKIWVASMFQHPLEPLPYLFFYGPQNSGKSIFHEALAELFDRGYVRADQALTSQSGFNGELEHAVLCVVEETSLKANKNAYNRIKDWVTARDVNIHVKCKTPTMIKNTMHWVQCSNDHSYCPIFPGDTRIVMTFVPPLDPLVLIPKSVLIERLIAEAPDFLAAVMSLEIPKSNDRLNLPIITTVDKQTVESTNRTPLEEFIEEKCLCLPGQRIAFSEFYERLMQWLDADTVGQHTKIMVGRNMPPCYPKGRCRKDSQFYFGNIGWRDTEYADAEGTYELKEGYLLLKDGSK
jgi:hypothetical protein